MSKIKEKPIYGLVLMIPDQLKIIEEYCFPVCRRLIVGGLDDPNTGPMFPCPVVASDCPRFDKEMDYPMGDVDGVPVILRRLK